jgi:hypothetical protein
MAVFQWRGWNGAGMVRFIIAILAISLLGGTVAQAQVPMFFVYTQHIPAAHVGNYENIQTVAVISAIGQKVTISYSNFWGSDSEEIEISQWGIDDQLTDAVKEYFDGRFDVVDVPHDRAALAAMRNGQLVVSTTELVEYLRALPADGVDAFIVVRPSKRYDTPGTELGLSVESSRNESVLWANYDIEIVGTQSYEIIADAYSRLVLREGEDVNFAAIYGSEALIFDGEIAPDEEQMAEMEVRFKRLVSLSLVETLRPLELGVTLPGVGGRNLVELPEDEDPYPGIEKIAVVSTIGDVFESHHLNTVFNQGHASISALDWNVDTFMEERAREAMGDRYTIVDPSLDRAALYSLNVADAENNLRETISELPASSEFYAYLVISKYPIGLTPAFYESMTGNGIGLWRTGQGLWVYAHFTVTLIDAETLEPIRVLTASASPKFEEPRRHRIDDSLSADEEEDFTPDKIEALRGETISFLQDMVDESMLRMLLTGRAVGSGFTGSNP